MQTAIADIEEIKDYFYTIRETFLNFERFKNKK